MIFWRNGEVKSGDLCKSAYCGGPAVVVTYSFYQSGILKVALVTCIAGVVQFSQIFLPKEEDIADLRKA